MSYQDQAGGYPPPREQESQYPPPPGEEDDRRAYHQRAPSSSSVTLPSISPYEYQQPPNGYPSDPRYPPQDPYRQPPPGGPYRDDRAQYEYARGGPQQMNFSQSAPRQRTAIACRYCRRRKVSTDNLFSLAGKPCLNISSLPRLGRFVLQCSHVGKADTSLDSLLRL